MPSKPPTPAHPSVTVPRGQGAQGELMHYLQEAFKIDEKSVLERPIYGTTIYLACCKLELTLGTFKVYTFQDIIHKGYVLALTYGDVSKADTLYCRVHSSCVTSETLRGCDCDCSEQLDAALKTIVRQGCGILFYLMQEGRGVGYLAKSRDRMLVQSFEETLSTFQAYRLIGLNQDYRRYEDIASALKMLYLQPKIILLTNNPEKTKALRALGVEVVRAEPLEFTPGPFNLSYLTSKMEAGHSLTKPAQSPLHALLPEQHIPPFKPHALEKAQRFVYVASYFLPIRPVRGHVVLSEKQYQALIAQRPLETLMTGATALIKGHTRLRGNRCMLSIHKKNVLQYCNAQPNDLVSTLLSQPYWMRLHVYSDTVSGEDFVVLCYGEIQPEDTPIVRLHSESLFSRFPLKDGSQRIKFNASIEKIVDYGCGILILLYNDGRGAGFGAYAQDQMLQERGLSHSTQESYDQLGVRYDRRDYDAALTLLKQHLPHDRIQMAVNGPNSLVNKPEYTAALHEHGLHVENWIFLNHGYGKN